jgi:hypothetical protein
VEIISGVKLYRDGAGRVTVAFCDDDRNHPDLIRRSRQVNARGAARGALDWASLTGKDARLWQAFRSLERQPLRLAQFLQDALASPATGFDLHPIQALDRARFTYWWRPEVLPDERATLGLDDGTDPLEIDLRIQVGRRALVYIRTFESGDWETFSDATYPDELARSIDFGTAEAHLHRIADFYLIAVTPDRDPLQGYATRIAEYRDHPDLLRVALAHRPELGLEEIGVLAGRIGCTTWAEAEAPEP